MIRPASFDAIPLSSYYYRHAALDAVTPVLVCLSDDFAAHAAATPSRRHDAFLSFIADTPCYAAAARLMAVADAATPLRCHMLPLMLLPRRQMDYAIDMMLMLELMPCQRR